jgi:hypothetical protein
MLDLLVIDLSGEVEWSAGSGRERFSGSRHRARRRTLPTGPLVRSVAGVCQGGWEFTVDLRNYITYCPVGRS